jgi:hypothetical protein
MFTLFHDPFSYRQTYWFPAFRQPSLFERYLDILNQKFVSGLTNQNVKSESSKQISDASQSPNSSESGKSTQSSIQQYQQFPPESGFEGRGYIEEHREKITGSDGEVKIVTRRRLGDHWYENEVFIDKDGKRTEHETWHNVGDEEIEQFKLEWSEKSNKNAVKGSEPESSASASSETETPK